MNKVNCEYSKNNRIEMLDILRGMSMIFVLVYHLLYDLIYIKNIDIPFFFSDTFEVLHTGFLIILFAVSGTCTSFSRNLLKRGVILFLIGELITIFTSIFMPDNIIVFGVISFLGISMILYEFVKKLTDKINWLIMLTFSILLYIITYRFTYGELNFIFAKVNISLPSNREYLYPIGILSENFRSVDYFPLIPNFFIFMAGTAIAKPIRQNKFPKWFYDIKIPILDFFGRHSLIIYLIHQPIFLAFMYIPDLFKI